MPVWAWSMGRAIRAEATRKTADWIDAGAAPPRPVSLGIVAGPRTQEPQVPYIEGFVAAVPTANKAKYIEHAREATGYFKSLGATRLVECWGDDVPK